MLKVDIYIRFIVWLNMEQQNSGSFVHIRDHDADVNERTLQHVMTSNFKLAVVFDTHYYYFSYDDDNIIIDNISKTICPVSMIHVIKSVTLNIKQLQYLLFNIYYWNGISTGNVKVNSYEQLLSKLKDLNITTSTLVHFVYHDNNTIENSDLFISDYVVVLSQLIFNAPSLNIANYQWLPRFYTHDFQQTFQRLNKLRLDIKDIFSPTEQQKVMIMGSTILTTLGIRCPHDLDITIYNMDDNNNNGKDGNNTKYIIGKCQQLSLCDPDYDVSARGYRDWEVGTYRDQFYLETWPTMFGASNYKDQFFNPKYHYYFLGLKLMSVESDVKRRVVRNLPKSYTDILALIFINNINILSGPVRITDTYWIRHANFKLTLDKVIELYGLIHRQLYDYYKVYVEWTTMLNYIVPPEHFLQALNDKRNRPRRLETCSF